MTEDEFSEFDVDEATFDAMLAEAEPARLIGAPEVVSLPAGGGDVVRFRRGLPISIGDATSTRTA